MKSILTIFWIGVNEEKTCQPGGGGARYALVRDLFRGFPRWETFDPLANDKKSANKLNYEIEQTNENK
jgi:hypothetical protein